MHMFMREVNACLYPHHAFDTYCERTRSRTRQPNIRRDNQNSRKQDFGVSRILALVGLFVSAGF